MSSMTPLLVKAKPSRRSFVRGVYLDLCRNYFGNSNVTLNLRPQSGPPSGASA